MSDFTGFPRIKDNFVDEVIRLSHVCARELGENSVAEIWVSQKLYDILSHECLKLPYGRRPAVWSNGLIEIQHATGKTRVRRAE